MIKRCCSLFLLTGVLFFLFLATGVAVNAEVPPQWVTAWENPPAQDRPLQIIHGGYGRYTTAESLRYFKDCGLGGLVVNVPSKDYLLDEKAWQRLVEHVAAAKEAGLRIWIYDEDGYPSLAAGGLVLQDHLELQSIGLVYDAENDSYYTRPAYEFTHASNKYSALCRYPNPIEEGATTRFLEVTHDAYVKNLGELFSYVEAFFTDEPSLNAVNIGALPEHVRSTIPTVDPVDPTLTPLPMVPWSNSLEKWFENNGGPINKKSLFMGDSAEDKKERERFWSGVSELSDRLFYREILDWCRNDRIAASGHMLHEEILVGHVPLDGSKLRLMRLFDIPGLDQLNSWPMANTHGAWKAQAFPCSAAALNGTRLVMTEISDFSQKMDQNNPKPASLDWMKAATAIEAAWGVTEFTLYYSISDRGEAQFKEYCDYVGRLNSILREAMPAYSALLYYPITTMQQEYRPTAEPLNIESQSSIMKNVIHSFDRLGVSLIRRQVPFILADDEGVKDWIALHGDRFPLFVPVGAEIPEAVAQSGLTIIRDNDNAAETVKEGRNRFETVWESFAPASDALTFGKFVRDGRQIYVVVNGDEMRYEGNLITPKTARFSCFNTETGQITEVESTNTIPVDLPGFNTLIFIEN